MDKQEAYRANTWPRAECGLVCGPNKNRNSLEDCCQMAHRVLMSETGAGQED